MRTSSPRTPSPQNSSPQVGSRGNRGTVFRTSTCSSSRPPGLRAVRRDRGPRILGPRMSRVAGAKVLPDLRVGAIPEASEIARRLHGATVRREQLEEDRLAANADPWRIREPEELLKLHGGHDRSVV